MYLDKRIIFLKESYNSKEEAISRLAEEFFRKNLVKETFYDAIIEREKGYPTGLDINGIGVAIPHTDGIHIIVPQIGFMSLNEPITFKNMVNDKEDIKVKAIFMLGLLKSEEQISMLQKLVELFQDKDLLEKVIGCKSADEFINIMKRADIY